MHSFNMPKPTNDKSTSILVDFRRPLSLINSPGPNHELVIRSSHLALLLSPNFSLLSYLQRVYYLLPVYCCGDMPLAIGSGTSTFLCKIIEPPPPQSTHSSRRLTHSSSENVLARLLLCLRVPIDSACPMTIFGGRLSLMASFRRAGKT